MSHHLMVCRDEVHVQERIVVGKNTLMLSGEKTDDFCLLIL